MEDDYNTTVIWAEQEEKLRTTRGQPVSNIYLFTLILFILGACLLVLYLLRKNNKETTALDLVQDPDNMLYEDFTQTEIEDDE